MNTPLMATALMFLVKMQNASVAKF